MNLPPEVVSQIEAEVKASINNQLAVGGISSEDLCKNKAAILGFLEMLVGLIPGIVGKLAGQAILVAANAWFKNKNC
jgi:hypothetical protein